MLILAMIGLHSYAKGGKINSDFIFLPETTEIKGKVIDQKTKSPLIYATLNLVESNISTITNTEGHFILKIPKSISKDKIVISYLGYKSKIIALDELNESFNTIMLEESVVDLQEVNLITRGNASSLVRQVYKNKADNYLNNYALMTAFYRETIKRRNRNVSLSEAVVNIYKAPYTSVRRDEIKLYKARKSTDYKRLDTIALKLQGGPFNSLFLDVIKYPEYIFDGELINNYEFNTVQTTEIDNKQIFVVEFKQKISVTNPLYKGKLYIDPVRKVLVSAVYSLNITDSKEAGNLFVRKKPKNAKVYPTEVVYRVDYKSKNNKWYFSYGSAQLQFKIDWDKKLFNTTYTMNSEMAITDWQKSLDSEKLKKKELMNTSIIMSDEVSGFTDPDFWGEHNIIEPDKNIESAIKKIQRKIQRNRNNS